MHLNRRQFTMLAAAASTAATTARAEIRHKPSRPKFRAVAFDGFPIIDARPVFAKADEMFPGRGAELSNAWRTRQFEYTWLRTIGGRYADFWRVSEEALTFAAKSVRIELSGEQRDRLMQTWLELKAWPDVLPALTRLREGGIRMAFLSNLTSAMLDAAVKNSGLEGFFEDHLTTDNVRVFKPDPLAYRMAIDAFGLKREEIVFAAHAGWDAAGAKWFGYPAFWLNRAGAVVEELEIAPDGTGTTLADLVSFVTSDRG
jgi:2-haloacid dehalogenase